MAKRCKEGRGGRTERRIEACQERVRTNQGSQCCCIQGAQIRPFLPLLGLHVFLQEEWRL